MSDGERRLSLIATLQRLLAVVDRCHEPTDSAMLEEWQRARAEAHMVLRREAGEADKDKATRRT